MFNHPHNPHNPNNWKGKGAIRIRKLILILCLAFVQASSCLLYAQDNSLTLALENVSVKQLFNSIEQQSIYKFSYRDVDLPPKNDVKIKVSKQSVEAVLMQILPSRNLKYEVVGNKVVVSLASAQSKSQKKISGIITDQNGESVIGASVVVKGTTTGTVTDIDGRFELEVPADAKLVVSYLGYRNQELSMVGKSSLDILLIEDTQALEEVVVVGYGTQKKASITGSVASLQSKDILTVKSANVSNALAGKLPGLRAIQRSGAPGDDDSQIDIRGFGSALVIVDGIERDFRQIDANDIESISILKDASAAVYGFKGANGVILVTTKKGMIGKPKINYTGYYGLQSVTRYPTYYDSYEYAVLYNEAQLNVGVNAPFTNEELEKYKAGNDPSYPNTDWWDATTRNYIPQMYHNLNVSGGAEKIKYFFSLGYMNQEGLYKSKDNSYEKYNVRSNISAEVSEGFTVDLQLSGRFNTRYKPYERESIIRGIQMAHPNLPIYANTTAPYWQATGDRSNPVQTSRVDEIGYDNRDRREFNGSIAFNWEVPWMQGLSAKALLAYDYNNLYSKKWFKEYYEYTYNSGTDTYNKSSRQALSELTTKAENSFTPTQQYSLNYKNTFEKHDVGALLLWEMYSYRKDWVEAFRQFDVSAIDQINAGNNANKNNSGSADVAAHQGLVGRINYAYASKYLAEISFRYDGSYKFAEEKRWGFFPAISLGWRISEESFLSDNIDLVDNLKIRGSYGKVGDEGDFAAFQYLRGYKYPDGSYVLGDGGLSTGASDNGLPNLDLTWYESTTANIGFEFSALNGLISAEFDYFERRRDGLLANRLLTLPTTFGQSLPQENLNSDKTRGFEIVVGHRNKIGDVTYDIKANFTTTREFNRYVERSMSTNMYDNWRNNTNDRYKKMSWGKRAVGQFQSYEEILNSPIQDGNGNKSLMPGDLKFQDWNNDGIIDGKDDQVIGHGDVPSMYYGLNMSADWKGIDATLFFQGAAGHEVFTGGDFMSPFIQQGLGNGVNMWLDRWHREDPTDLFSKWIPGEMPALRPTGYVANSTNNTWTMQKANYLRLKSIEIGYTIPKSYLHRLGVENLRVYINSFNPLTFTSRKGVMKFMDPENNDSHMRYYPQMKSYNFGVNLTF
ncbi:SusC/RagA family TonB-linked outer membrane protein [Bacteroidales bacterium]|nr:SusC/RagA family TonB-linked outer membrane protein [Bacteroidales bacterium]